MKSISSAFSAHLSGALTTLATCWRVERTDGTVMGFTEFDQDIPFESVTYAAATGFTKSAIESTVDLSGANLEAQGLLDAAGITADDLRAGVYDGADLRVFLVNWADTAMGSLKEVRAKFGDVSIQDGLFIATIVGLAQELDQQALTQPYTPSCRADLGDSKCKKDLTDFTDTGTVTAVTSRKAFTADISTARADGFHDGGRLSFTSGANIGRPWLEMKTYLSPDSFALFLDAPFTVAVGDTFTVVAGCDKTAVTCIAKFDNLVNFQGEDKIAGLDSMLETPNAS